MKKNFYVVMDKVTKTEVFVFVEVNDNRAVRNAIASLTQVIPWNETELYRCGEYDDKKVKSYEKPILIDYKETIRMETESTEKDPKDIKPIEK